MPSGAVALLEGRQLSSVKHSNFGQQSRKPMLMPSRNKNIVETAKLRATEWSIALELKVQSTQTRLASFSYRHATDSFSRPRKQNPLVKNISSLTILSELGIRPPNFKIPDFELLIRPHFELRDFNDSYTSNTLVILPFALAISMRSGTPNTKNQVWGVRGASPLRKQ